MVAVNGQVRGGMGVAGVFSGMLFAALSGSSPSTVAAIGPIAIVLMEEKIILAALPVGLYRNAGTLGILIPPSIVMVVYAAATNESVGRLFLSWCGARLVGWLDAGWGYSDRDGPSENQKTLLGRFPRRL